MLTQGMRLLVEVGEPLRGRHILRIQHNAADDHRHCRLEPAVLDFHAIAALTEFNADACDFPGFGEETALLVYGHQVGHRLLQAQREGFEIAFGISIEAAQPSRLHVEIHIVHCCTAAARTSRMPETRRSRIATSLASRSRSPAATSRSICITSCIVLIASSAACARTSMLRASPPKLRPHWLQPDVPL